MARSRRRLLKRITRTSGSSVYPEEESERFMITRDLISLLSKKYVAYRAAKLDLMRLVDVFRKYPSGAVRSAASNAYSALLAEDPYDELDSLFDALYDALEVIRDEER